MSYLPATVRVMSDSTRHLGDADGSTANWARFVVHLESRLTAIEPEGSLVIDLASVAGDGAPYVQVKKSPEGNVLDAELSSHQFLDERFAMSPDVASSLLELGWFPPIGGGTEVDRPNFFVGTDVGAESDLASMIAASFREAFPQFGPDLLEQSIEGGDLPTKGAPGGVDRQGVAEVWADFTSEFQTRLLDAPSASRLEMRVDHSLGDSSPTITAYTVDHGRGALIEVSSNQTLPLHARLSATQIGTLLSLGWNPPSAPNDDPQIPSFHFMVRIADLEVLTTLLVDTLQSVFGIPHPTFLEPAPRETELHGPASSEDPHEEHEDDDALTEELLALIHMDNEPGIEVSPELAARVFQRDRSLILDCIRQCEEQAINWGVSARTEDDDETAEVCKGEAVAWEDMASLLRRSLPFTIE